MQDHQDGRRQFVGRRPSVRLLRFLELLDSGMRPADAAREVGVSSRTASDWAKGHYQGQQQPVHLRRQAGAVHLVEGATEAAA